MALKETDSLRLLLIGATGAGKSCTGNTIFSISDSVQGRIFQDGMYSHHNTTQNEEFTSEVLRRQVTIMDTPGLENQAERAREIVNEVKAAIKNSKKPYDAFLFVVNIFKNGLEMDDLTLKVINDISSKISKDFWKYAVLVFTYEDNFIELQKRERGIGYEQFSVVEYVNKSRASGKKYAIGRVAEEADIQAVASINNMETDKEKIKKKVEDLFYEVDCVRRKNGYSRFGKEKLNPEPVAKPSPEPEKKRCSVM